MLFSMCVIELARKGQEATTFELVITVSNTATTLASILAVQLLSAVQASGCQDENGCPSDTVDTTSSTNFEASDGPYRFTIYCLVLTVIMVVGLIVFTPFLPGSKAECEEWCLIGEQSGNSLSRAWVTFFLAFTTVAVPISICSPLIFNLFLYCFLLCFVFYFIVFSMALLFVFYSSTIRLLASRLWVALDARQRKWKWEGKLGQTAFSFHASNSSKSFIIPIELL